LTPAALGATSTARDLLFGAVPGEPTALAESLRERGVITSPVPGLTAIVQREVARATDGLLSMNLTDVVAAGWAKHHALRQAALRTRHATSTREIVVLATHSVESAHHPTVEVFVDGTSFAILEVELSLAVRIAGARAVVERARLTAVESGTCTVRGQLAVRRIVVAKRTCPFDLPGAIRLRNGVPLLELSPPGRPAPSHRDTRRG